MSLTARRSFASLDTNGAISNICTLYCLLCVFYSVSVYSANRIHPFLPPNHTLSNVNHIQIPIAPVGNPSRNSGIRSLHSGIICCIRYYRQTIGTHPSRHPREMYCTTARYALSYRVPGLPARKLEQASSITRTDPSPGRAILRQRSPRGWVACILRTDMCSNGRVG